MASKRLDFMSQRAQIEVEAACAQFEELLQKYQFMGMGLKTKIDTCVLHIISERMIFIISRDIISERMIFSTSSNGSPFLQNQDADPGDPGHSGQREPSQGKAGWRWDIVYRIE